MSDVQQSPNNPTIEGINIAFPLPYRVAFIITLGIWAWGLNLYYLSALRIDVPSLIKYTSRTGSGSTHYQRIFRLAWTATILLSLSLFIFWIFTHGNKDIVLSWDILPMTNLVIIAILFALPLQRLSKTGRYRFLSTLKRISIGGIAEAQDGKFGDILLADALTSYSRILGDLVVSICMFFTPDVSANSLPNRDCGSEILVPVVISIPSLIRLRQCLIEYDRVRQNPTRLTGWGGQHLANALKYSTAFPVIILNALQRQAKDQHNSYASALNKLWFCAVTINSLYSFYWDVMKDWDLTLLGPKRDNPEYPWGLRRKLHFSPNSLYYTVIAGDLVLRLTWMSRLTPSLDRVNNTEEGIFLMESLEVFRRWVWIFFRVETEWVRSSGSTEDVILLGEIDRLGFD